MGTKKSILLMYISQALTLVAIFLLTWLISSKLGENAFAEYSIFRRGITFLSMISALGMSVAAPRILVERVVAIQKSRDYVSKSIAFEFGLSLIILFLMSFALFVIIQPGKIAFMVMGANVDAMFGWIFVMYIMAFYMYSYCYEIFRIIMKFKQIFLLQIGYFVFIPLFSFVVYENSSLINILLLTGAMNIIWTLGFLIYINTFLLHGNKKIYSKNILYLLKYYLTYALVPIILYTLLSVPIFILAHMQDGKVIAGYVGFSMILITLTGQIFLPLFTVLRTKLLFFSKDENHETLYSFLKILLFILMILSFVLFLFIYYAIPYILEKYFYPTRIDSDIVMLMKLMMFSSIGYLFYVTCFSFIESISLDKRSILYSVVIALIVLLICLILTKLFYYSPLGIVVSSLCSFITLGFVSFIQVFNKLKRWRYANE